MDFALLPPEVNSGRMYTGSGSSPMLAAAAAWDGLATELHDMAIAYESAVAELTAGWRGPSSVTMATAAAPYTTWLKTTATQAEEAAGQSRSAAAAYEAAFAATVPPPLITANRSLLAALVATNLLGQNAPAIATTEAHYSEMWAQDAAAMYGYAGSAAAATALSPFTEPPQTTDSAGPARQSVTAPLRQLIRTVPNTVRNLNAAARPAAATASPIESVLQSITEVMSAVTGPYSPLGHVGLTGGWWLVFGQILGLAQNPPGVANLLGAPKPVTGAFAPLAGYPLVSAGTTAPGGVTGALSRAGLIGNLSVPPAWAANTPGAQAVTAALSSTTSATAVTEEDQTVAFGGAAAASGLASRVMNATAARSVTGAAPRTIGTAAAYTLAPAAVPDATGEVTIIVVPAANDPH